MDVLSSCRSFLLCFYLFFYTFLYILLSGTFCLYFRRNFVSTPSLQLHVNWWAGLNFKALYLEFFFPPKTPYLTLFSHRYSHVQNLVFPRESGQIILAPLVLNSVRTYIPAYRPSPSCLHFCVSRCILAKISFSEKRMQYYVPDNHFMDKYEEILELGCQKRLQWL